MIKMGFFGRIEDQESSSSKPSDALLHLHDSESKFSSHSVSRLANKY